MDLNNNAQVQVSGDRVVWDGYVNGYWKVFTWHSGDSTPTQITTGEYINDYSPQVSGDRIVWYRGGINRQVFTQKVGESSATTLTVAGTENLWPEVSGDHVVWQGNDGGPWQIFEATPADSPVSIPDPNLSDAVHTALSIPTSTPLFESDMLKLTWLQVEAGGIVRLDGLEHATNMTWFDLIGNDITTITPLASLTHLNSAVLSNNHISDVSPLASLVASLTNVVLDHNQVSDVTPLKNLVNLTDLELNDNQICDISQLSSLHADYYNVSNNWLDLTPGSAASTTIDAWLAKPGASVTYLPQRVGGIVQGAVTAAGGGPVSGATVVLGAGPVAPAPGATSSGKTGSYGLHVIPPGSWTLTVSKPYYVTRVVTVWVSAGITTYANVALTPVRLALTIKRSPSGSSLTYKRKKGVAKFTLSATLTDARGAVANKYVWLQKSTNGKKWTNLYKLKTSSTGKVSKPFAVKKKGTTYYCWSAPVTTFDRAGVTTKQKVVVK